ncbi:MAG: fumarate reductase/succinate dehydrogenase flavoprotein domain protein [Microbacteriaceae bacterium]|nr:fumarate reductase/succinate dehydrogenase flavoprotein domain protein [Microbacteriaceae bacterium]
MDRFEHFDVIVIGGGSAAHEAAVAAKDNGAERVLMLEKAPEETSGGNARYSGTGFRFVFEPDEIAEICDLSTEEAATLSLLPYTAELFHADLNRVTQGRIDPELAGILVGDSNDSIRWAKKMGITWQLQPGIWKNGKQYFSPGIPIHPTNLGGGRTNGLSQLIQWDRIAEGLGIEKRFRNKVIGFLGDETGIDGVVVKGPEGRYEVRADAVIAASGGFQANARMRAAYLGPNADTMKVRGSRHDTGEVMRMLLDLGAQPSGQWQGAHASPIDFSAPDIESGYNVIRYSYCWGLTVNELGQRFFDEGEAEVSYTYAKTGWAVQRQPGSSAFQVGDQKVWAQYDDRFKPTEAIWADTLDELAQKMGVNPDVFVSTISEFNAAVDGSTPFDPTVRDGRRTNGLAVDKTNWAQKLDEGPYFAGRVTGGVTFTFGGIKVDTDARVISIGGEPIPRLYATGDILGIFFHNYPSMTGQTRNLVFARRAGQHAMSLAPVR